MLAKTPHSDLFGSGTLRRRPQNNARSIIEVDILLAGQSPYFCKERRKNLTSSSEELSVQQYFSIVCVSLDIDLILWCIN